MSDTLSLKEMSPVIEEILSSGGKVRIVASGNSMEPVINDGQDTVVLQGIGKKLQKNDIVLFKRKNGKLVLHRIIAVDVDSVTLRGDNQWTMETVDKSAVIGILESIERDGKTFCADGDYFEKHKKYLPLIRWKRRIINSIKIRLGAKNK